MIDDKELNILHESHSMKDFAMDEKTASKYALQVALQTMKERCQEVQKRLSAVEEENLKLKLENESYSARSEETRPFSSSEEQVIQLTKQKSQLTHHICMVANENKQLWTRLSQLTEVNESLGDHLNKISDALNKHSVVASKPNNSLSLVAKLDRKISGAKDESLEEISLKILNSFKQEKSDLEQQYNDMVELQKIQSECTLSSEFDTPMDEIRPDTILLDMKNCKEQMNMMEKTVKLQQELLLSALEKIKTKKFLSKTICSNCELQKKENLVVNDKISMSHDSKEAVNRENFIENQLNTPSVCGTKNVRVCPLCLKSFDFSNFPLFQDHVSDHFVQDDESDLPSILHHFEVVGPH